MRKYLVTGTLCLLAGTLRLPAQAASTRADEALTADAVRALDQFAMQCQRSKAFRRARIAWLEIVSEYDPDHERTRKSLGHQLSGKVWHPPEVRQREPDPIDDRTRTALDKAWDKVCAKLGAMHRRVAEQMQGIGRTEKARHHFRRALRFVPDDAVAGAALGLEELAGVWLTPLQRQIELRVRLVDQAVEVLRKTTFEVQPIPETETHPVIEKANPAMARAFRGFRGPTVKVFSDYDPDTARAAVQAIERSQLLMRALLLGNPDYRWHEDRAPDFVLTGNRIRFHQLVEASDNSEKEKQFTKDHLSGVWYHQGDLGIYVNYFEKNPKDWVLDAAVRNTFAYIGGMDTAALDEGLGHSGCGWLLGKSLNFTLDLAQRKPPPEAGGTVASRPKPEPPSDEVLIPDVGLWRPLMHEQAWEGTGPDLSELLLFTIQDLPHIARVQSWSWIHYALARDPSLLRRLDAAARNAHTGTRPGEVRKRFDAASAGEMNRLEADWRDYWRVDEPRLARRRRVADDPVDQWLQGISAQRAAARRVPFGHAPGLPAVAREMLARPGVLSALDAGSDPAELLLEEEQRSCFAKMLFVPKDLLGKAELHPDLLVLPGWRDLLCAPLQGILRYQQVAKGVVLFVPPVPAPQAGGKRRTSRAVTSTTPVVFPEDGATGVPARFPVALLGARAVQLLDIAWDVGSSKFLGYPVSLHLGPQGGDHDPEATCEIQVAGKPVAVTAIRPRDGLPRKLALPSTYVCIPRQPLPGGAKVVATWTWFPQGGGREERRISFTTR